MVDKIPYDQIYKEEIENFFNNYGKIKNKTDDPTRNTITWVYEKWGCVIMGEDDITIISNRKKEKEIINKLEKLTKN